ncbi:MAG: IS200/IS605 family transposase [Anaerolineae bacterium]|nr:IS200/IS605 family transposase [Anaerolineae bacterium]MCO5205565.1 IS200/IS605 family transposase [Anaerolineae bacterium]
MSRLIKKSHNVSILLYHIVCPIKYRRKVIDDEVEKAIKAICLDIEERYQIEFLEIGTDKDHVHFLVQSVPTYSPTKIVTTIKSLVAKHVFKRVPSIKKHLWGAEFWTDGFYIGTVGQNVTESVIQQYVKKQGRQKEYRTVHVRQLKLF